MDAPFTLAHQKLVQLVNETSAMAVGRKAGCLANTVRLLCGGGRPKLPTIEKLRAVGIQPGDWFAFAEDHSGALCVVPATVSAAPLYGHEPTLVVRTAPAAGCTDTRTAT